MDSIRDKPAVRRASFGVIALSQESGRIGSGGDVDWRSVEHHLHMDGDGKEIALS